jgi:hypothetical protein
MSGSDVENPTAILIDASGNETGVVANPLFVETPPGNVQEVLLKTPEGSSVPDLWYTFGEMLSELRQMRRLLEILTDEKAHDEE